MVDYKSCGSFMMNLYNDARCVVRVVSSHVSWLEKKFPIRL